LKLEDGAPLVFCKREISGLQWNYEWTQVSWGNQWSDFLEF